ncbi:MAG: signal peptidase II [Gammaproteobacteria bacterium]|nr:signal peptidase II [Gammaproteobacteria bacterium]
MLRLWWISAAVIGLDQLTKVLAVKMLSKGVIPVLPFFDLELAYNTGAAFGFLHDAGGWQRIFFIVLAVAVSIVIVTMVRKLRQDELQLAVALMLVLGGAIGNVIDRIYLGKVVDFLHFFYGTWSWPNFNIADSAISVGAVLLIVDSFGWRIIGRRSGSNEAQEKQV